MNNIQRPAMDPSLYEPSHAWAIAHIACALALFGLPAWASYRLAIADIPLGVQAAAVALLTVLAGYGLNMMGLVGHEGTHGNLTRNKTLSALAGIFCASAVVSYMEMGFALSHWNHHRFTNQKDDSNIDPVAGLKTWWQRLLLARVNYNLLYLKHTLQLALGKPPYFKYKVAYDEKDQVLFARLNFVFAAVWIGLYAAVFVYDWRAGVFGVLLPMIAVKFIAACQIFIDHGGLADDRLFRNAWSRTSPLMTLLFFGANYHLEHHAYPRIPCYRLPRVHRILRESGIYDTVDPPIVEGFLASFKPLLLPYGASALGDDFDPFQRDKAPPAARLQAANGAIPGSKP